MRLFHFSDDPGIAVFEPRPVRTPVERPGGQDWLNGPLVWAIEGSHAQLYLFPRDCPRILVWPKPGSLAADTERWMGRSGAAAGVAFVEAAWMERIAGAVVHRYELPAGGFEALGDVGMWVSRSAVRPMAVEALTGLPGQLARHGFELRPLPSLLPLKAVWGSSLHASGLRLRNAQGWGEPGWPHSPGAIPPPAVAG